MTGEVLKQVYQAQALAPPTGLAQIKAAYQTFYANASNVAWWQSIFANGQWKTLTLYGLEAYGFFKVGEIVSISLAALFVTLSGSLTQTGLVQIGRRHLVGYKVDKHH